MVVYSSVVSGERFEQKLELEQPPAQNKRVSVVIDERGLVLDGIIVCTRYRFFGGGFEELAGHCRVLIMAKPNDPYAQQFWFLRAPDNDTAKAMLRAAGLDAESSALQIRTSGGRWKAGTILIPLMAMILALSIGRSALLLSAVCVAVIALAIGAQLAGPWLGRVDLQIGTDGILRTRFRRTLFFPFTKIRRAWSLGSRVAMQLVDGSILDLKIAVDQATEPPDTTGQISLDYALVQLIKMRVLAGIARSVASLETVHQDFEVARGARELHAWLTELRKKRVALADYRTAPQPEIDLDAVFDDSSLDAQTRAGAAIALRVRDGDEAASRLRVAASTTASPELRMALEKIADGSFDDDLEERLQKLR